MDDLQSLRYHPLFQSSISLIKEISMDRIDIEAIIKVISKDIYSAKAPLNDTTYNELLNKSELFKPFFEDLYNEMDQIYYGEGEYHLLKSQFALFLQQEYDITLELTEEGNNIIVSNCLALMKKLNLTSQEMAEYLYQYLI